MMSVQNLTNGNPSGSLVGQSATDKVGFFGDTPVVLPASASQAVVAQTVTTTIVSAAVNVDLAAIIVLVNQLRSDLVDLGLIKGQA